MGQESTTPMPGQIHEKTFQLVSVTAGQQQVPLPAEPPIALRLDGAGRISGRSTVNLYFGSVQWTPDGGIWGSAYGLATTRRSGPPDLMDLETLYFQALERTTQLSWDGSTLTLSSPGPMIKLVFETQATPQAATEIFGKQLTLTGLTANGQSVALPDKPLVQMAVTAEGMGSGFSGVNRFFGKFLIASDGSVNAGYFGTTMMAGTRELMDLETAFYKAVSSVKRVEVAGSAVRFYDSAGVVVLQFQMR